MTLLEKLSDLWLHLFWADGLLLRALEASGEAPHEAVREYAHTLGAEEVWLARLEGRPPRTAVWPDASAADLRELVERTHDAWKTFVGSLREADLARDVAYRNSTGRPFTNSVGDILLHVALHGQYHRGKVNLLLRQHGHEPAPVDYIAYVRGVPAATAPPEPRSR